MKHWKKYWTPHKNKLQTIKLISQEHYKTFGIALGIIFISSFFLILSNTLFLAFLGMTERDANPFHFLQYGIAVWDDPGLRFKWLLSLGLPISLLVAFIFFIQQKNQAKLHGGAHWASIFEAQKAGVFAKSGILLGKKWGRYLKVDGFEHVFVFAPSGSGKTTSLVIPNLLNWQGSIIAIDLKLSLFSLTSRFRQEHGHACFLWNPGTRDGMTHCYNPIDWVSADKSLRIDDLQKIAHILIPDNSKTDKIWTAQPRNLFIALALYLLDTPGLNNTLGDLVRLVKNTTNFAYWILEILRERTDLDPLCYRNFNSFLQTEYRLQTNILQSFMSYFELFDNPYIDAATSKSDFDITQLRKTPMTIYVGISPDNLVRLSPLVTLFYQQVLDALLRNLPDPKSETHGVLLLLDEFSALQKMATLQKGIGLLREYHVRMMIFVQDLPQLYSTYGRDEAQAFINNKVRIAFAQNDLESAKLISSWLGDQTVKQRTFNQKIFSLGLDSHNETVSQTRRELLKPTEIMQLPKNKSIIVVEGNAPLLGLKNFWYSDPNLKVRAKGAIDIPNITPILIPFDLKTFIPERKRDESKQLDKLEDEDLEDDAELESN